MKQAIGEIGRVVGTLCFTILAAASLAEGAYLTAILAFVVALACWLAPLFFKRPILLSSAPRRQRVYVVVGMSLTEGRTLYSAYNICVDHPITWEGVQEVVRSIEAHKIKEGYEVCPNTGIIISWIPLAEDDSMEATAEKSHD